MNTTLTAKEAAFLICCLNYNTVEGQLADNYSNGGIKQAMALFPEHADKATKRKAAGGLLTSLNQKGFGQLNTEFDQFEMTEVGVRAAFAAK